MMRLCLATGNKGKLAEWQRILSSSIEIEAHSFDLDEIQGLNISEIVEDKARRAFDILKRPVVVEDVSAGIEKLNWLPGPFIKFFIKEMGEDALFKLSGKEEQPARVTCAIAYYDGNELFSVKGEVLGKVVSPRGSNGFGFDKVFMPTGSSKTYSEMTLEQKDRVSHRSKAIRLFDRKLKEMT